MRTEREVGQLKFRMMLKTILRMNRVLKYAVPHRASVIIVWVEI
jgi:hypothetical protein